MVYLKVLQELLVYFEVLSPSWAAVEREGVELLLEHHEPLGHEGHVVEQHPVPAEVGLAQAVHGDHVLPLAHGHVLVGAAGDHAVLLRDHVREDDVNVAIRVMLESIISLSI